MIKTKPLLPSVGLEEKPEAGLKPSPVEETPCFQGKRKRKWGQIPDKLWILQCCLLNEKTGCWEWQKCIGSTGYGNLYVDGKTEGAHRLAYVLWRGPIPDNSFVLHKCDNRKCCNPNHLFIGTQRDNMHDASIKNRMNRKYYGGKGDKRFTDKEVMEIRSVDIGTNEWARMVGTCPSVIRAIRQYRTYKWVR